MRKAMATRKRKGNQMWKSQIYQPHCISWGLSISLHVPLHPRYVLTWTVYSYMASRCCGVRSNRTMSMGSEASVLLSVLIWDGGGATSLGGCRWSVGRGRVRVKSYRAVNNSKLKRGNRLEEIPLMLPWDYNCDNWQACHRSWNKT